jgi:hypothetical protein
MPSHAVAISVDAFFWSRRSGVLVARAKGKNLLWREISSETLGEYKALLRDIQAAGIQALSFVIDGRPGVRRLLNEMFPCAPVQLCQFHAVQTMTKYLTKNPKLEAGRQLRELALQLKHCGRVQFARKLRKWHRRWDSFLGERVEDEDGKRRYKHRRLRSAYRSLNRNLPWLFACKDHPNLRIPNTTNSCDGWFAHLKQRVKIHRGLRADRRSKMADFLLESGVA